MTAWIDPSAALCSGIKRFWNAERTNILGPKNKKHDLKAALSTMLMCYEGKSAAAHWLRCCRFTQIKSDQRICATRRNAASELLLPFGAICRKLSLFSWAGSSSLLNSWLHFTDALQMQIQAVSHTTDPGIHGASYSRETWPPEAVYLLSLLVKQAEPERPWPTVPSSFLVTCSL